MSHPSHFCRRRHRHGRNHAHDPSSMKSLSLFLLSLMALLAIAPDNAFAQTLDVPFEMSQRGPGRGPGGGQMRWLDQLDLTSEQLEEIQAIRDRYQPQFDTQRDEIQAQRQQMHDLMAGNASESEIRQQHSQMRQLHQEMGELHFNSMMEIRNVLTEEQRQQMADWMEQRREDGFGPGHGRGHGHGQGRGQGRGRGNW